MNAIFQLKEIFPAFRPRTVGLCLLVALLLSACANKEKQQAGSLLQAGAIKFSNGDYDGAIKDLNRALELTPDNPDIYGVRAMVKDHQGDFKGAIDDFTKAISFKPSSVLYYFERSMSENNLGDSANALKDMDKSLQLDPNVSPAWINRASIKQEQGDFAGAVKDYEKYIDLDKNADLVFLHRYILLRRLNRSGGDLVKDISRKLDSSIWGQSLSHITNYLVG